MRRGKQKVRMSTSVTEIDADNSVKVRKTKRKSAGRRPAEKDPLALPKRKPKAVPTKAARKQPAQPEEYEVEKIVGHREKGGTTVFRIRWKGWAAKDDTWQEEDDLNCGAILKKYKATLKATASPKKSAAASPKKQGRASLTAAAKKSPKKGVAAGKVTKKKMGRPSATKSPKKKTKKAAEGGKKRGRKPKSETEWEVEEVTAVRTTEAGTEEFYIKWKGYSSEENTWEPAENVANCDKAINRFRESQGEDGAPATTNGDAEEEEEDGGGDEEKEAAAEEEEDEKDVSGVAEEADDASMDE